MRINEEKLEITIDNDDFIGRILQNIQVLIDENQFTYEMFCLGCCMWSIFRDPFV